MPRVRWLMSVPVLCFILVHAFCGIDIVAADCWYENEKHEEGVEVATAEPCLNCTCSRGALLCYLRVCPKLPNPPPPGCILLHRYRSCCPELICSDVPSGNGIEGRAENDGFEIEQDTNQEYACMMNGSIYGSGSAMDSSTDCEYCYCLRGQQRCVKPKCLLPLDGCIPTYNSDDCCPAHYNCTNNLFTTTTTLPPHDFESKGGCIVDGDFYPEGGKVLGLGHSTCDNCYCLRNLVRCEPLSCAPPLLGCTPVIKPGECCAASYNCSGTIETHPEPHYGDFPIVSKEYAKLRKEVQHKRTTSKFMGGERGNTNVPFYVLPETISTHDKKIFAHPITQNPFYYNLGNIKEKYTENVVEKNQSFPEIYYVATKVEKTTSIKPKEFSDSLATTIRHKKYVNDELLKAKIENADGRNIRKIDNKNQTENQTEDQTENQTEIQTETTTTLLTESTTEQTTIDYTTLNFQDISTETTTETFLKESTTIDYDSTTMLTTTEHLDYTTVESNSQSITVMNSTECSLKNESEVQSKEYNVSTEASVTTEEVTGVTHIDILAPVKMKTPIEIQVILNRTKDKEHDFDYDYNPPTLPPSLPNLRIIPFVAADALDPKKSPAKNGFSEERISETSFPFGNQFSPPAETEGGFVPKEPPLLDDFYDKNYHTTNIGSNLVTPHPVPAITNPPKSNENNCMVDGKEMKHGDSVNSEGTCTVCICYFGSIVCHEPHCPIPRSGCRNSNAIDISTCCPHLICDDEESPTVVLDRLEVTSNKPQDVVTVAEGVVSPDPFRHVIRTEPAPDLKLLIGDMSNFLLKQTTSTTTEATTTQKEIVNDDDSFSLDKVWQYLFSATDDKTDSKVDVTTAATYLETSSISEDSLSSGNLEIHRNGVETRESVNDLVRQKGSYDPPGLAYFKLAGCNIYGRMYRVGRIISELSGPCLECKCTEVGVQCATLKC